MILSWFLYGVGLQMHIVHVVTSKYRPQDVRDTLQTNNGLSIGWTPRDLECQILDGQYLSQISLICQI